MGSALSKSGLKPLPFCGSLVERSSQKVSSTHSKPKDEDVPTWMLTPESSLSPISGVSSTTLDISCDPSSENTPSFFPSFDSVAERPESRQERPSIHVQDGTPGLLSRRGARSESTTRENTSSVPKETQNTPSINCSASPLLPVSRLHRCSKSEPQVNGVDFLLPGVSTPCGLRRSKQKTMHRNPKRS
ncbi:uncharacterized protein LOC121372293 [Gigantopelta aegis]|uniref:uncharacterized protein LOC121372293 n=1 Tax=Gigantopelta aegis TaxID=1735272 RepID=UPI001B88CA82|nr:uncharacterized protein LOC121372293 [Gigantopelta aegis]